VCADRAAIDDLDRRLIVATQAGLPLQARPYDAIGDLLGIDGGQVRARLARLLDTGVIRRIGAVPNHYALGYTANAMTVWDVDDARVDELGQAVGALAFVTHCYRRPRRLPQWPYNLFAMVHGRSRGQVERQIRQIGDLLGCDCRARDVLYSSRILKKTGLRLAADPAGATPQQSNPHRET
jgi:DNA-binding Lrp family transcriptional regulator